MKNFARFQTPNYTYR